MLTLPGWIGLAFAGLSDGIALSDLVLAAAIFVGAIAMRGAGCAFNDIIDQDFDALVDRAALRPLPAGAVTEKQAWIWVIIQCLIGLLILLCLPRLSQILALCSIPLVLAYPFMKRITWWPQLWLGLTLNWAALVAYAAKVEVVSLSVLILYIGLVFWTLGYDTIYACQDKEDDAVIGVKSTARRFGSHVVLGVGAVYFISFLLISVALGQNGFQEYSLLSIPFGLLLIWQIGKFDPSSSDLSLELFKFNVWTGLFLLTPILSTAYFSSY